MARLVRMGLDVEEDLPRYAYRPEVVVDSLAELADRMECHGWRPSWRTAKERLAMAV